MGMAILRQAKTGEPIEPVAVSYCETKPTPKKKLDFRANVDDRRRLREVWDWLVAGMEQYMPMAVGVEAFQPGHETKRPQGAGNTVWKAGMGYALVNAAAWTYGVPIFTFIPQDVKRAFHLKRSTSKTDIAFTLASKFRGLPDLIDSRAKKQHEHLYDAVGLAYLAFEELYNLRALTGV